MGKIGKKTHIWQMSIAPLPVGFPQKHQGSATDTKVRFGNISLLCSTHHRAARNTPPLLNLLSTLHWELLWGRPRLLTDCQSPAAEAKLETAATVINCVWRENYKYENIWQTA